MDMKTVAVFGGKIMFASACLLGLNASLNSAADDIKGSKKVVKKEKDTVVEVKVTT